MARAVKHLAYGALVTAIALAMGGVVVGADAEPTRVVADDDGAAARSRDVAAAEITGSAEPAESAEVTTSAPGGARGSADVPLLNPAALSHAASRADARALTDAAGEAGVTLTVVVDGTAHELTTTAPTLHEALAAAGIALGWDDVVSHDLAAPPTEGAEVTVTHAAIDYVTEDVVTPFETEERETADLPLGERRVVQEGSDGVGSVTYRVSRLGGAESGREIVLAAVGSEPVTEIVEVGTRVPEPEPAARPAARPASGGSGSAAAGSGASVGSGASGGGSAVASTAGNRALGQQLMLERGFAAEEWSCLEALWTRESNWNHLAANPTSSARGIPQAMMSAHFGASWRDPSNAAAQQYLSDPATQIRWGLDYIAGRYTTPCAAWGHSQAKGWY